MSEIISRADALAAGLRHYFTGIPCKRGHVCQRWSKNSICVLCSKEAADAWRAAHPERVNELDAKRRAANPRRADEYKKAWKERNREKIREASKEYYRNNIEKVAAAGKRWREANKEQFRLMVTEWRKANPGKASAFISARRAARINATPPWADKAAILAMYNEATAKGLSVDHIIPLRNKLVCGLHVQGNLQLLTPVENSRKGNKFNPADFDWPDRKEHHHGAHREVCAGLGAD